MIDSTALGGVVDDCAAGSAELVVEADAGGECEQAGADAGEQVFAGEEDRLDPLADRCQPRPALGLVAAGWTDDPSAQAGDCFGELAAGVALVADDRLAATQCVPEQRQRNLALRPVGTDKRCRTRGAIGCARSGARALAAEARHGGDQVPRLGRPQAPRPRGGLGVPAVRRPADDDQAREGDYPVPARCGGRARAPRGSSCRPRAHPHPGGRGRGGAAPARRAAARSTRRARRTPTGRESTSPSFPRPPSIGKLARRVAPHSISREVGWADGRSLPAGLQRGSRER